MIRGPIEMTIGSSRAHLQRASHHSGTAECPIELPAGWSIDTHPTFGTLITARQGFGALGYVTIDEQQRSFELGISAVRCVRPYIGRGWREKLYSAAVTALKSAIDRASHAHRSTLTNL